MKIAILILIASTLAAFGQTATNQTQSNLKAQPETISQEIKEIDSVIKEYDDKIASLRKKQTYYTKAIPVEIHSGLSTEAYLKRLQKIDTEIAALEKDRQTWIDRRREKVTQELELKENSRKQDSP